MSLDIPGWIQTGALVVSLSVGAMGSYYTMDNRVSTVEQKVEELPEAIKDLNGAIRSLDASTKRLEIATAVMQTQIEGMRERKGR